MQFFREQDCIIPMAFFNIELDFTKFDDPPVDWNLNSIKVIVINERENFPTPCNQDTLFKLVAKLNFFERFDIKQLQRIVQRSTNVV
jgi:hypothetical protein